MTEKVVPIFDLALKIEEWWRQGPSYVDQQLAEVVGVKGPYVSSIINEWADSYPYNKGHTLVLIPTTETEYMIVRIDKADNTVDPPEYDHYYLVYVRGFGWWKFSDSDAEKIKNIGIKKEEIEKIVENAVLKGD